VNPEDRAIGNVVLGLVIGVIALIVIALRSC
jgi:hypothetical protein